MFADKFNYHNLRNSPFIDDKKQPYNLNKYDGRRMIPFKTLTFFHLK